MLAKKFSKFPYLKYRQMKSGRSVQKKEGHKWDYERDAEQIGDAYTFIGA